MFVVVPNHVRDAINAKIDEKIKGHPEAAKERGRIYDQLLRYYDEHGTVPDFTLTRLDEK